MTMAQVQLPMTFDELSPLLRENEQGLFVPCHVQPKASKTAISGIYGDAIKISLAAPPVDGKANTELMTFFAKKLGVSKSSVSLVSGQTSRRKVIFISGITKEVFAHAVI